MIVTRDSIETLRIPTLPASVLKVRDLLAREDVGTAEVAAALAQDPPLAVKVLRIANSVQYGSREAKTSIQAATSILGLRAVSSIVLRAGVLSLFENLKDTPEFSVTAIWRHSILTGHAAEELARLLRRRTADFTPQDHYTCGLLHDIGRIVLFDNFGEDYVRLLNGRPEGQSQIEAESSGLLGLDHAEMGALAARMWRLPDPIPDMIRYHHSSTLKASIADVVGITACADQIADLVLDNPEAEARDLAAMVRFPAPSCPPAAAEELIQAVRKHAASIVV